MMKKHSDTIGYDNFDMFINRLLLLTYPVNEAIRELEPEMVFYQKTPARVILQLSKKVNREDVFFDIGSGMGQVVIFVNLISSAKSIGIEFEPSFCNYAKEVALKLDLGYTEFINVDARKADYSTGTIFFLYTPFVGKMMHEVLALLQKISLKKVIKIFTYGPCSMTIAKQNWLNCINGTANSTYKFYEFKSLPLENFHINFIETKSKK